MGFIASIALLLGGILAISGLIIKKKPEAKDLIDKLAKYQGYIGIALAIWGAFGVVWTILHLSWIEYLGFGYWISILLNYVVSLLVGAVLGYGMIQKLALAKASDEQKEKAEGVYQKLVNIQIPLGFAALLIGLWGIVANIIW